MRVLVIDPDQARGALVAEGLGTVDPAAAVGAVEGGLLRVRPARAEAVVVAKITDRQRPGGLFMPMHWTDAFAPSGRSSRLIAANVDPTSGQPEFKHTPARIRPYRETWRGFFLAREAWTVPTGLGLVWRRIPQGACQLHEFAGRGDDAEREALRRYANKGAAGEVIAYDDPGPSARREAWIAHGRVDRVLFTTARGRLPPRDWLADFFAQETLDPAARASLLIGRPTGRYVDPGSMVCVCLKVGTRVLNAAIAAGATSVDAVSTATGAGSNCGSCRPRIARMIAEANPPREVEARQAA